MKTTIYSCSKSNIDSNYVKEYSVYQPTVSALKSKISKEVTDSANVILEGYLQRIAPMSCIWCVAEGEVFKPVKNYCNKHPEAITFVLDKYLTDTTSRLTWAFRALVKEHFTDAYNGLLKDFGIVLKPESELLTENDKWNNQVNEFKLPFEAIVKKYLEINK